MDSTTQLLHDIRDAVTRIEARQGSTDAAVTRVEAKLGVLVGALAESDEPDLLDTQPGAGSIEPSDPK